MTLFEALTGGAFDHLSWQHSGQFDQNFSKKENARGFARGFCPGGGRWVVLELTGTLCHGFKVFCLILSLSGCYCMDLTNNLLSVDP